LKVHETAGVSLCWTRFSVIQSDFVGSYQAFYSADAAILLKPQISKSLTYNPETMVQPVESEFGITQTQDKEGY
jgi:hypothetical protein